MGNLQKKRRTTGKKPLAYREKSGQNTGNDFLALGLGVVLYLPKKDWREGEEKIVTIASNVCHGVSRQKNNQTTTTFCDALFVHHAVS